ncbi:serine kinase [Pectobacteriaceae bacterium CE90]|nr:serine kinase [Pectobacteriaceae bacterium CE90]
MNPDTHEITPQDRLAWVQWWAYGCGLQADNSWHAAGSSAGEAALLASVAPVYHHLLRSRRTVPDDFPAWPEPKLLHLAALHPVQRQWVLILIATVCREQPQNRLSESVSVWCRRLAKALRPGLWLPDTLLFNTRRDSDALCILRSHYPAACWSRLRLLFPQTVSEQAEQHEIGGLPAARITTLCEAIIWKVSSDSAAFITPSPM